MLHHQRPTKFSDPFGDFSVEELNGIVEKPDEQLGDVDYMMIFQHHLPAGTYNESSYFISPMFAYLNREYVNGREITADVLDHFMCWCQQYAGDLIHDDADELVRSELLGLFCKIADQFKLTELHPKHIFPMVPLQLGAITELLSGMVSYEFFRETIPMATAYLTHDISYAHAGWILTLNGWTAPPLICFPAGILEAAHQAINQHLAITDAKFDRLFWQDWETRMARYIELQETWHRKKL